MKTRIAIAAALVLTFLTIVVAKPVSADDAFGAVASVTDQPASITFKKCKTEGKGDPAICQEWDAAKTFRAPRARIVNLGEEVVWVHVLQATLPVLPKQSIVVEAPNQYGLASVGLSVEKGKSGRAHVFASNPTILLP